MKKVLLLAVILTAIVLGSCGPSSSLTEAMGVVSEENDCDHIVQGLFIEGGGGMATYAKVTDSYPYASIIDDKVVVSIIIYQTKDSTMKLALLNDDRPPKIIAKRTLK